jgi:hypothetical protein
MNAFLTYLDGGDLFVSVLVIFGAIYLADAFKGVL